MEAKDTMHSHVTGNGGVSGHWLGREVVVTVRAVEERLSPLAVDKIGLQNEAWAWAGHWVKRAATWWRAIVHIKTVKEEKKKQNDQNLKLCITNKLVHTNRYYKLPKKKRIFNRSGNICNHIGPLNHSRREEVKIKCNSQASQVWCSFKTQTIREGIRGSNLFGVNFKYQLLTVKIWSVWLPPAFYVPILIKEQTILHCL